MAQLTPSHDHAEPETEGGAWGRAPLAVRIGVLYVLSRLVTTGFFFIAAELSGPASRYGPDATVGTFAMGWDAQWYWMVAVNGYPSALPLTESGQVAENQWAFMPVYPFLAQTVGLPFGSWAVGALLISLVSGYLACLALHALLKRRIGDGAALWATLFFASGPLAALFQVAYAETLFLLWLFLALWAVERRRYVWLYLLIPLMGYTRPGILAFALFLALHGIHRWVTRRREPLPLSHIAHIVVLGLLAVVIGFSWQVFAALVTGDAGAYLATELAWRRNWIGDAESTFIPFDGFVHAAAFWFTTWGFGPVVGYVALGALVVGVAALLVFEPHIRRLGVDIRLWSASYLVYLLLVFFPQSSIFRLLVPLSPLFGAAAVPRSRWWRGGFLALCLLGQWWWIYNMYALANTYWQIP